MAVRQPRNVDTKGVILRGGDATSYAAGGTPAAGASDFLAEVNSATHLFAPAAALWEKDPAGTLAKTKANWPIIIGKTPPSLE